MNINRPPTEVIRKAFREYDQIPEPRDRVHKMMDIIALFHNHYMEKIEIILAIAGEMQKHFREVK
uniref:Uncharacterized protein n=1 Tax=viral metagenome TaxID=1070528 RepID=A0A6M3IXL1_9ZZZZ